MTQHRFYHEFAPWWPLLSPVEDYAEEAAEIARVLQQQGDVRTVLELGSGGGHNAAHLKEHFALTLTDLSPEMLEQSRNLNPECAHLQGDMRALRLQKTFDAVLVHDAIDYLTTEDDVRALLATAWEHCRPGGVVLLLPDHTREDFASDSEHGGTDAPDGRGIRYLEWTWDPNPDDSWAQTEYAFLFRDADGTVRTAHETHRFGLFSRQTWTRLLEEQGFTARMQEEETSEDRTPRVFFLGLRPEAA